ncbi:heterokaryon incompatibility protein [Fusarium mundagurra]|uniref:Heterokaryon incompatibility protein n=1 Tax=Fusarium mundagurra TaxID=1567541 RepID=A0A8H6DHF4_9HYPO|nr:heterokaryon incompatibility protein [Fusarium mundagurra]
MRLLSAKDLQFEERTGDNIPKYAILSHRWGNEEPCYWDMKNTIVQRETRIPGKGPQWRNRTYHKIHQFSLMALQAGYEYIWVDTCCIDKSSSAELQESINSMYRWYMESEVCYAYLSDVSTSTDCERHKGSASSKPWTESFRNSEWFTRGWTLQELLAPRDLIFFDKDWIRCGNRVELQDDIQAATGIDATSLMRASRKDGTYLRSIRLGRLFSWAASRQTTRCEDRAYSLLGIFDVNMPLLYGETDRAFYRLQEEIIKTNEDASLLAWNYTEADDGFAPNGLAKSPSNFQNYRILIGKESAPVPYLAFSPRMIARGLQATLKVRRDPYEKRLGYAVLAHDRDRRSLVLPVLFCELTFVRTPIQNECVRLSDPIWIPSWFVNKAKPKPICFIRHVEATDLYDPGDGLTLGPAVWKNYITTFTYPIQTQAGRRHFPALLGRFSTTSERKENDYTFIVELAARIDAKRRYIVIVDYRSNGTTVANNMTVTVIRRQWHINLAYATKLVQRRQSRQDSKSCKLPDEYGNAIPTGEIISIAHFTGLWVREAGNSLSSRTRKDVGVRTLGLIRTGSFSKKL